jgi:hypothetical protein
MQKSIMKRILTWLCIFLLGLACGVSAMFVVAYRGPEAVIDNTLYSIVYAHVRYARLLDEDKTEELRSVIAQEIEHGPVLMAGMKVREPIATNALRMVKSYYTKAGKPFPDSIKAQLDAVPPRPPCPLKSLKDGAAGKDN